MSLPILTILILILTVSIPAQKNFPASQTNPDRKNELPAKEIARRALPSVALVECDNGSKEVSRGSGFFIKPGILLTNYHVIESNNRGLIKVAYGSNQEELLLPIASIISYDEESDLALLFIPDAKKFNIPTLPLAKEGKPHEVGETIYALGNPRRLFGTISPGIISAALRNTEKKSLIQITAPISPGSSGGPVVNTQGEVIGVAVGAISEGQNLNFAAPVSLIYTLLSSTKLPLNLDKSTLSYTEPPLINGWGWAQKPKTFVSEIPQNTQDYIPARPSGLPDIPKSETLNFRTVPYAQDKWNYIGLAQENFFYINPAKIQISDSELIRAWAKIVNYKERTNTQSFFEIKCNSREYRTLNVVVYDSTNNALIRSQDYANKSKFQLIVPDTMADRFSTKACLYQ